MTRILLFAPLYPPYSGGSPTYFSNVIDSLSEEHTFIVVTAYHSDKQIITKSNGNSIYRMIPFRQSLPNSVRALLESLIAFIISFYFMSFSPIKLAHIHATSYASPAIAVAASIANVPIIYDCRDLSFPPWIINIGSQPLVFSCAPNVDDILREEGIPENRIVRVPIANPEYVAEYADESKRIDSDKSKDFTVVYVGNLKKFKGVGILIDVFEEFAQGKDDIKLQIIGDGPYRSTLLKHVDESGLGEHVEIIGEIDHREALRYISCSDVLVHPSARETGPRSVTEAIELGTPVIATPVGIVPEIIDSGDNGIIVNRSIEDIERSISNLYEHPDYRRELAKTAAENSAEFDWENMTKTTSEAYDTITNTDG